MDGCWRGLWRKPAVVSRKITTIYWGTLAPAPRVVDDRRDGDDAALGRKRVGTAIAGSMRTRCGRVACSTGGSYGERDTGRWGLRKFVAADAEYSAGGLTHFADWHRRRCDLAFALEHNLDSNG